MKHVVQAPLQLAVAWVQHANEFAVCLALGKAIKSNNCKQRKASVMNDGQET